MKIYISYFYQVRKFEQNMIPFSTAKWDPKWFHKFEGQGKIFVDERGIINGLRLPELCFPSNYYNDLKDSGQEYVKDCPLMNKVEYQLKQNELKNEWNNFGCKFMNFYFKYLWDNVDFDKLMNKLQTVAEKYKKELDLDEVDIVLLVHEAPSVPCAERPVLKRWFAEYGYDLEEWNPYE